MLKFYLILDFWILSDSAPQYYYCILRIKDMEVFCFSEVFSWYSVDHWIYQHLGYVTMYQHYISTIRPSERLKTEKTPRLKMPSTVEAETSGRRFRITGHASVHGNNNYAHIILHIIKHIKNYSHRKPQVTTRIFWP